MPKGTFQGHFKVVSLLISAFFISLLIHTEGFAKDSKKVLLVSLDGGANTLLHSFMDTLPKNSGFRKIQREGQLAQNGMTVSLPSLTATSHISLITGLPPSQHGVVSNRFHLPNTPIHQEVNGFAAKIDPRAKTLWEKAMAKGKKVGVISYPSLDNTTKRRSADWSLNYTKSRGPSRIRDFTRGDFSRYTGTLPRDVKTFSPAMTSQLVITEIEDAEKKKPRPRKLKVIVIDSTNDRKKNYDTLFVDTPSNLRRGRAQGATRKDRWFPITFRSSGALTGSWAKLISLSPTLNDARVYVGPLYQTKAFPRSFQKIVDREAGVWPGPPDRRFLHKGLTEEDLLTQAVRLSEYLKDVTLAGAKHMPWDLILTYQPILDELEHQFYLVDPQQKDYTAKKSRHYMELIRRGYLQAGKILDNIMKTFPKTNLIVVSDHGMAPIHHVYYPNRVLSMRGYIEDGELSAAPEAKKYYARAFSSGGLSHVYLNLKGRESNGIVPKKRYAQLQQELVALFRRESVIDKVYTRQEATHVGLNHPNSGDIILVAKPGYHINDSMGNGNILEPASFYGQHGYSPTKPSMKALFAAWGPNVPRKNVRSISYRNIAPFALKLLGK